jgi:cytoskeletal protein RodZ
VDYADFGKYLAQQRELRGLSREEVSQATRIPGALIAALEEGELTRLPGRVFVVNYIRSYAEEIGLSPDEAVLRFEEVDQALQEQANPPASAPVGARPVARTKATNAVSASESRGRWTPWLLVVLVVVAVVVGALAGTGHLPLHLPRR